MVNPSKQNRTPRCSYPGCSREANYYMSWTIADSKCFGNVCATHDRILGRQNLIAAGMTAAEAVEFDVKLSKEKEAAHGNV